MAKNRATASTHKKVVILLLDRTTVRGYLDPGPLGRADLVDLLTPDGEHKSLALEKMKSVYFVRELDDAFELERKAFLSRPKLDGLWVRLRFRDEDVVEGMVSNDLLGLLEDGLGRPGRVLRDVRGARGRRHRAWRRSADTRSRPAGAVHGTRELIPFLDDAIPHARSGGRGVWHTRAPGCVARLRRVCGDVACRDAAVACL